MSTYTLIQSQTLASSAASVTFSAIPSTFTDLVFKLSATMSPTSQDSDYASLRLSASSLSTYSGIQLYTAGSSSSVTAVSNIIGPNNDSIPISLACSQTAGYLGYGEIYIPNYTVTATKQILVNSGWEGNVTNWNGNSPMRQNMANLFSTTTPITVVRIAASGNFVTGSSFYLYGISNA